MTINIMSCLDHNRQKKGIPLLKAFPQNLTLLTGRIAIEDKISSTTGFWNPSFEKSVDEINHSNQQ
jgi:hypothetical protein